MVALSLYRPLCHMMTPTARRLSSRPLFLACAFALLAGPSVGTAPASKTPHRAHLSTDLIAHEARRSTVRTRAIVHGSPSQIASLAERHHLTVARILDGGAVVLANSAELSDL